MTDMTRTPSNQLEMRWLPVVDANGRSRMEAVWITPGQVASLVRPHAA